MNVLLAARTNYGKSYTAQRFIELNADHYDRVVVLDYKDEYKGLVEAGLLKRYPTGPKELEGAGVVWWQQLIQSHDGLQLPRKEVDDEEWREIASTIAKAVREMDESVFLAIDEAHFVAPQSQLRSPLRGLATTGDGEGVSTVWITQRLAELDETVIAQCTAKMLGGFNSDADLRKIQSKIDYPAEVHNVERSGSIPNLPDSLHDPSEGPIPLRRHTDEEGNTTGSEWVWSDDQDLERINTRDDDRWTCKSNHYGGDRNRVIRP
jgi:hypothetical protein